jgi:pentatricopeptide repeat protein
MPRKPVTLLKLLIALGGCWVPEHRVVDALWPGEDGDSARRAYEMAVHRLRVILGARDAIHVEDGTISLNRLICWVDAYDAQRLLADATAETETGSRAAMLHTAEHLIRLYRGVFLPADEDAPWAVSMREGLRARYTRYVGAVGARLERDGRVEDAIVWYQRGLDTDNLAESFYQGLMRCHLRAGRHAEGLAAFCRMRELFSVLLGARPSRTSEALHHALQSH